MEKKTIITVKGAKSPRSTLVHPFKKNFGKVLFLIMEGGQIVFRNLLDKKVSELEHGSLRKYLQNAERYQVLLRHHNDNQITVKQWQTMYPLNETDLVTSKNFDIIVLSILVIHTCHFTGELQQDVQQLKKKRNSFYCQVEEGGVLPDMKFEHEFETVLQILVDIGRWVSIDVENRMKDLARFAKNMEMTQDTLDLYVTSLLTWCISEMDTRKCLSELKTTVKAGKTNSQHVNKVLQRLKTLAEEHCENDPKLDALQPDILKKELAKIAFILRQQRNSEDKLSTVKNIMGLLSSESYSKQDLEYISKKLPRSHEFREESFHFKLVNLVQENLSDILQDGGILVAEICTRIYVGDLRSPQTEIYILKELNNPHKQKLFLQAMTNIKMTVKRRSLLLQEASVKPKSATLLEVFGDVKVVETAVLSIFKDGDVQRKLTQSGPCCLGSKLSDDILVDINVMWKIQDSPNQDQGYDEFTSMNNKFHFHMEKYFIAGDYSNEIDSAEVKASPNIIIDMLVKKGKESDTQMEEKLARALHQLKWSDGLIPSESVADVTVEIAVPKLDFRFASNDAMKRFYQSSEQQSLKNLILNIFEEKPIKDLLTGSSFDFVVRVEFHISEYLVRGIIEPGPPSLPRLVRVVDATTHTLTIEWDVPETDYGLPILSYHVERFDFIKKKWLRVGSTEPPVTVCRVANLEMGHKYKIRVFAVNKLGRSKPSTTDGPVALLRLPGSRGKSLAVNGHTDL